VELLLCSPVTKYFGPLVNQIIAIGTQPAANQSVCSGTSASLNVVATGAGITYQWRKGTTILTNGGSISGATTATLTINPAVSSDSSSDYNVVITGTAPCALTSNNACSFGGKPSCCNNCPTANDTNLMFRKYASFSVTATGTALS
jgi:hypothetical protein